ncbi:hypothetical protein BDW02DRAFT_571478 [Decorospora gaudefroyi]|uniref:Uncharacterized protein n=1 Tax=Decorospora gaudefroyi TaxID=184978 RepID=A0A6A5K4X5_9PLEO|nr:hypothetical protein BDW02DRAFT_571478 [Decorospora gaudefroyi]
MEEPYRCYNEDEYMSGKVLKPGTQPVDRVLGPEKNAVNFMGIEIGAEGRPGGATTEKFVGDEF